MSALFIATHFEKHFHKLTERRYFLKFIIFLNLLSILNFAMTKRFCYVACFARVFIIVFFSLKHDIFVIKKLFYNTHQVRCHHFFIVEIIVESVNLIQMSK